MDMNSRKQYLQEVQKEYLKANKKEKGYLLEEAKKRTGMDKKYIIRKLSPETIWDKPSRKPSLKTREYDSDLIYPLVQLWDIFDEPCGQRLEPLIKAELDKLRYLEEIFLNDGQTEKLKKMSPKTIDRLLEHEKAVRIIEEKYAKKKNNPLLYQVIPTKLSDEWNRAITGQIQLDGVEHCGASAQGEYINTISTTDISSHWWEGEGAIGKGQRRTCQAIANCRGRFPFNWTEVHPDNGSSFINYFVWDYVKETDLKFSRSRPYKKNDNCFVEQKNSQNVRKVVGHVRYDTQRELAILNDLYRNELSDYKNFFQPVMRLELKQRSKGHIYRKYQKAKTPYQWLMDDPNTPDEIKQELKQRYNSLNPAELKRNIENKLKLLAEVYAAKEHRATQKLEQSDDAKVTFSFDPTTPFRLPTLVT